MCINKVRVLDLLHGRIANYFPCGHCKSCRQAAADRRSRMISGHVRRGMFCYFVTLGYARNCVPYIKLSDLNDRYDEFSAGFNRSDKFSLPIYRDVEIYKTGRRDRGKLRKSPEKIIGYQELSNDIFINSDYYSDNIASMMPVRYKVKNKFYYEYNQVSVAFAPDARDFYKRLRQNLFRDYGKRIPIEYYYAPEYGPTTGRFHIHTLLWMPSYFTELQVKYYVAQAWPFASPVRTKQYCQSAKNPANYLASYVNSDANISPFLTENFKLRPTHSLDFGFNETLFGFKNVYDSYKQGHYTYVGVVAAPNGATTLAHLPYPRYVMSRYFPIFKGLGRLTKRTAIHIYKNPRKYFALTPSITRERDDGTTYHMSNIIDGRGNIITFTRYEAEHYIKIIERAYLTYFRPLGYSRNAFGIEVYHYWNMYFRLLYKQSLQDKTPLEQARTFYNLSDLSDEIIDAQGQRPKVLNFSLQEIISAHDELDLDCNTFPEEILYTEQKEAKYNRNIKQRKINSFNCI